jgi:hypothetical protein
MRRVLILTGVLLGAGPSLWTVAYACGDKFMMVGHAARFTQVYAAIYPSTILLYVHSGRGASSTLLDPKFQASLTRAGHHIEVARDEERLAETLRTGRVDLVLTDLDSIDAIKPSAEQSPSRPSVLPVIDKLTKAQVEAIKTRYQAELKPSDRPAKYLAAIDTQMQARVKLRGPRKTP